MGLPRFQRLPEERRRRILDVARAHIARSGPDVASYNEIIAEAGISKASAYQYFDGKDDLVVEVGKDSLARVLNLLGPWESSDGAEGFWRQFTAGTARLFGFLDAEPEHLAVLHGVYANERLRAAVAAESPASTWFEQLLDDGASQAVIREDVDRSLLVAATVGVFTAIDGWALARMRSGAEPDLDQAMRLLRGLWKPEEMR